MTEQLPALYLSHGAPPLADDPIWTAQLAQWSADLPKPKAILMISAHWEEAPLALSAIDTVPLVYDFGGFEQRYYEVQYRAPGAPELAARVAKLLRSPFNPIVQTDRGLDHGAYVPLVEMYPEADVPVLQISMPTLDPVRLVEIGRKLAPLRQEGVLIVGSGFATHNLRLAGGPVASVDYGPQWSMEFDAWMKETLDNKDYDALINFEHAAPAGRLAHPRTEHFAPLFVAIGATLETTQTPTHVIDGFWVGMSKRSLQFA
jgi:4,5-DOPA dioxygenase extradiol